jgi:hypothetical protein
MAHPLAPEPEANNAQEAAAAAADQGQEVLPVFADAQPLTMVPQGNAPPVIPPGQHLQRTAAWDQLPQERRDCQFCNKKLLQ